MRPQAQAVSLFDRGILKEAAKESLRKLSPSKVIRNPVMFVVEIGSILTTLVALRDALAPASRSAPLWFTISISLWLWFTVIFANFAEAVAEGRGKAQAASLRKMRTQTSARKLKTPSGPEETVSADSLRAGDLVVIDAGELVPGDGEVATAKSSRVSPRSTSRPSPASPRPSFEKAAAIARQSPAARACFRIASLRASPPILATPSWTA